jgi:hypothetical protein
MTSKAEDIVKWYDDLKSERANFDSLNQEIIDYILPHNSDILSAQASGEKRTCNIFDSTAMYGSFVLSQFIQGSVFNPATKWFSLDNKDRENDGVAEWLKATQEKILAELRRANFYQAGGQAINSWVGFGNGPILIEDVPQKYEGLSRLRYTSIPFGQYVMAEGVDGKIDTFIRCIKMKARHAAEVFDPKNGGNGVSDQLSRLAEKEPFRDVEILHSIHPRELTSYSKGKLRAAKDMPFASCWIERDRRRIVKESGYRKFPVALARYDLISGEVYGRGPGGLALPDAKSLNRGDEAELVAWERELDKPLLIARNSVIGGSISVKAGGQTVVSDVNNSVKALFDKTNFQIDDLMRKRKEQAILRVFHVNEILNLLAREKPEMTAFEVNARLSLLQQILGPVFGRLESDFLSVIVEVTLDNMAYAGMIDAPPDEVSSKGSKGALDVQYEGPLARAQRNQEILAIQQSIADVGGIAQMDQEIIAMVDFEKATRKLFEIRGTQDMLLGETEYTKKINEMRKRQDAEKMAALAGGTADALGKVAPFLKVQREQSASGSPETLGG